MSKIHYGLVWMYLLGTLTPLLGQSLRNFEEEFIEIIAKSRAAAVSIEIVSKQTGNNRLNSGILLDQEGHIVTVANSLKDQQKVAVWLESRQQYEARVVGTDPHTNIAVLKIDAPDLMPVKQGYSGDLRVGAFLIIIGNPYGLAKSVSYGITSGLNRAVWLEGQGAPITGLIQTNASISPGDAGGLVVDSQGKFIGMVSSTLSRNLMWSGSHNAVLQKLKTVLKQSSHATQMPDAEVVKILEIVLQQLPGNAIGSQGINFILPSATIYWVAEQIIKQGEVHRGWIGVDVKDSDAGDGVVVTHVVPDSPAAHSDIKIDDRLTVIDGETIVNSLTLLHRISHASTGQTVTFTIIRSQEKLTVALQLGKNPKK